MIRGRVFTGAKWTKLLQITQIWRFRSSGRLIFYRVIVDMILYESEEAREREYKMHVQDERRRKERSTIRENSFINNAYDFE